jgi:hypothetical protein
MDSNTSFIQIDRLNINDDDTFEDANTKSNSSISSFDSTDSIKSIEYKKSNLSVTQLPELNFVKVTSLMDDDDGLNFVKPENTDGIENTADIENTERKEKMEE